MQRCLGDAVRTVYDWNVTTEPQMFLSGRRQNLTIGRVLGGSSTINGMMFDRGSPSDYDMWEDLGNEGWGWKGLLPYFRKVRYSTIVDPPLGSREAENWTLERDIHPPKAGTRRGIWNHMGPSISWN